MTASQEKRIYPYVPARAWWDLRKRFVQAPPGRVTRDYLQSVLGTGENAASDVLGALKSLGLVAEDGRLTQVAHDWRSDEHYSDACRKMIEAVYPSELLDAFPEDNPSRDAVQKWFLRNTGTGENAAYKRALMYVLLKQADPNPPEPARAAKAAAKSDGVAQRQARTAPPRPARAAKAAPATTEHVSPIAPPPTDEGKLVRDAGSPSLHIDVQVHIAADASADQIDQIFASMAKHLYNRD